RALGLAGVILLVETIGSRIAPISKEESYWELKDDGRAFGLIPNFEGFLISPEFSHRIQTNALGFRDHRNATQIMNADKMILCMGDSFTFGYGVNYQDMFSQQLESLLQAQKCDYAVVSSGHENGWSPVQYDFYLRRYMDELQPDVVVAAVFPTNDLHDHKVLRRVYNEQGEEVAQELSAYTVVDGKFMDARFVDGKKHQESQSLYQSLEDILENAWRDGKAWLYSRSYTFRVIELLWARYIEKRPGLWFELPYFHLTGAPREDDTLYKETLQSLLDMNAFCARQGVPFVVMLIPDKLQVSEAYHPQLLAASNADNTTQGLLEQALVTKQPQQFLTSFFEEHGIRYIDLLDDLREADKTTDMYYRMDGHWLPVGHELVADILYQYLAENRLLDCPAD
ncbi:MAG: alginate O-acetyltransferase AlgX-related protein, partial [Desulfovibrionaceae bacterium]